MRNFFSKKNSKNVYFQKSEQDLKYHIELFKVQNEVQIKKTYKYKIRKSLAVSERETGIEPAALSLGS